MGVSVPPVQQRTVIQALQSTIKTPFFPPKLPPTVVEMCEQYRVNGLQEFKTVKMTSWATKWKILYRKLRYANNKVKERAIRLNIRTIKQRMSRVAETMDEERLHLGQSTSQYVTHLKKHDPVAKERKRSDEIL